MATTFVSMAEAVALRERIIAFQARTGLATTEMARATGLTFAGIHYIRSGRRIRPERASHATLTQFMDGFDRSHRGGVEKIERNELGHALVETESARRCDAPENFVMTASAKVVANALDYCARRRINGAIFGEPGVGKSEAMRQWSATTKFRHAVIFCRAYSSYTRLLRAVGRAVGVEGPMQVGEMDEAIHDEVAARPLLLVIDEADMLNARTLDWLRTLWDESAHRTSFVLLAKPAFYQRLQTAHARSRQDLRQVWRRLAFRKFLSGISREEALDYCAKRGLAGKLDAGAADALHQACAGSFGDLDMLIELLGQMLDENPKLGGRVTVALVHKAREVRFGADIGRRR